MVPIVKKDGDRDAVNAAVDGIAAAAKAAGIRIRVDAQADRTPGWKFNYWEMKVGNSNPPFLLQHLRFCLSGAHCASQMIGRLGGGVLEGPGGGGGG